MSNLLTDVPKGSPEAVYARLGPTLTVEDSPNVSLTDTEPFADCLLGHRAGQRTNGHYIIYRQLRAGLPARVVSHGRGDHVFRVNTVLIGALMVRNISLWKRPVTLLKKIPMSTMLVTGKPQSAIPILVQRQIPKPTERLRINRKLLIGIGISANVVSQKIFHRLAGDPPSCRVVFRSVVCETSTAACTCRRRVWDTSMQRTPLFGALFAGLAIGRKPKAGCVTAFNFAKGGSREHLSALIAALLSRLHRHSMDLSSDVATPAVTAARGHFVALIIPLVGMGYA